MNAFPRRAGDSLVRVFPGLLAGQPVQLCDARELHAFLGVGRDFASWIKVRIGQYGFVDGADFVSKSAAPPNGGAGNRGARIDYHLSLDMAKELAMVERSERGRQARRYFIDCERKLLEQQRAPRWPAEGSPQVMPVGTRVLMVFRPDGHAHTRVLREDERLVSLGDIAGLVDARETLRRVTERNEMDLQVMDAQKRGLLDE